MCLSEFFRTITCAVVDGLQNNLAQLFSITCRCAICNIRSSRVKVTLEDQIFVWTITGTILGGSLLICKIVFHHDVSFEGFIGLTQRSRSCGFDKLSLDNILVKKTGRCGGIGVAKVHLVFELQHHLKKIGDL